MANTTSGAAAENRIDRLVIHPSLSRKLAQSDYSVSLESEAEGFLAQPPLRRSDEHPKLKIIGATLLDLVTLGQCA